MRKILIFIPLIFSSCTLIFSDETNNQSTYFVQLTDTHFAFGGSMSNLAKAVGLINRLPFKISFG